MIRIVRLGTPRRPGEGLRIGTVRRPPRGVAKARLATDDWYDVWWPNLAPSAETVALALAATTPAEWRTFERRYRAEMAAPERRHDLSLLAALSTRTPLAVGCYCADEAHCHRGILRRLLEAAGAEVDPALS